MDKSIDNSVEAGRSKLELLQIEAEKLPNNLNEADTRFQLIDRLFVECLGWPKETMLLETEEDRDYTDYIFQAPRPILIVEAKREAKTFELPSGHGKIDYQLPTLMRGNKDLKEALEQVAGYCQKRGIPLAVVANGHQLVAFLAVRSDAVSPLKGDAVVFASIKIMLENFHDLWNLLSKDGVEDGHLRRRLIGDSIAELPPKLSSRLENYPGLMKRNEFQAEMQVLSDTVIGDLARTAGSMAEFLQHCYCTNSELSQYSLLSKMTIEARYASLFDADVPGPSVSKATSARSIQADLIGGGMSKRPVLLIGDVGVGKTTFIENLINVEAPEIFSEAISIYIDLGSQGALTQNLEAFIVNDAITQLQQNFSIDIDEDDMVRLVYAQDLERFKKGVNKTLLQTNRNLYIEKEIAELEKYIADREAHLRHSLFHLAEERGKLVVVFIDNADQRSEETQQKAFLVAQEMAASWPATVFVALRPETYYRSAKIGALTGYHLKAVTISPPPTEEVVRKRLNFAKSIVTGALPLRTRSGFTGLKLDKLTSLIDVFLQSMQRRALPEFIENVSSGNVRNALEMVTTFFGSGHVDTRKICDIYDQSGGYIIPLHEMLRAVIFGDAIHYTSEQTSIVNLFDLGTLDGKEHFILPLLIGVLQILERTQPDNGFVVASPIYERMQQFGFTPEQIDTALVRGTRTRLIEAARRRIPEPGNSLPSAFRPTSLGTYHIRRLVYEFSYLDAMAEDTPVLLPQSSSRIMAAQEIGQRIKRAIAFCNYLDAQWKTLTLSSNSLAFNWEQVSIAAKAQIDSIWQKFEVGSDDDHQFD